MAPMKNILAALALASFTTAIPVAVDRRAPANTVTETTWTTVDVTTTVYVDGPSAQPKVENASPAPAAAVTTSVAPAAEETSAVAAPPQQAAANAPAAFAEQPAQPSAPVVSSAAPVVSSEPASSAPPASTAAVQPKTAGSSSGSGPCEGEGSGCSGDATHWDGGLGACGWNVDTATDMQIALPVGLMGSQSNGNPYCGRSVTIKSPSGGTVSATVGDKCMGCTGDSIDMTDALFAAALPGGDGRVSGVQWWFD